MQLLYLSAEATTRGWSSWEILSCSWWPLNICSSTSQTIMKDIWQWVYPSSVLHFIPRLVCFIFLIFFFFFYSLWCIVSTTAIFNSHFYLFGVWWYIQITMNDDFWPFLIILNECHQYDNIKSAWLKKYPLECLHVSCFPENQAYSCTWNVWNYLP